MKTSQLFVTAMLMFGGAVFADKPNVIIVMPDDVSHGVFTYYNPNSSSKTPNIDRLAASSVRLTDFHVSPSCAPTRAATLTGRSNSVSGIWHTIAGRSLLRNDEITIADVFKHNGYKTGMVGKWHLGDNYPFRPKDRGFQYVAWTKGGGVGQQPDFWGNMHHAAHYWVNDTLVKMADEDDGLKGAFVTNSMFNRAFEFMEESQNEDKPFFLYLPTAAAHSPWPKAPGDARSGLGSKPATVENIDKNVGRLVRFLDDKRLADNTILIFFTDNGSGEFMYRGGKISFYDGGTRVPCFIRWPAGGLGGAGKGRDVTPLTAHMDWLPTLMEMANLKDVPDRPQNLNLHGRSFRAFLDTDPRNDPGAEFKNRTVTICNMRNETFEKYKQLSVKKDEWDQNAIAHKWRLTRKGSKSPWELWDVLTDKAQTEDLSGDPKNSAIVGELKQAYEDWYTLVAEREHEFARTVIGNPAEPITQLNSHDFHNQELWNHKIVAQGKTGSGFLAVEFAKAGTYHFDLRRWPKEIEDQSTLTSAPAGKVYDGKSVPKPLDIASGRIKIWNGDNVYVDERKDAVEGADGIPFTVKDLPAGPAFIQTWFYNSAGDPEGAVYYNYARPDGVDSELSRDERLEWWREAKFGMFVHWGVYSVVGGKYKGQDLPNSAEWMMARGKIPISEYEKYAAQFNPAKFDADEFVGRAKRAGMKYIVITAKHHDGFAMFGSKCSDYNVVDKTPFARDIMKELAEACQRQGIKFGFYYSQAQDWHHPGGFGNGWDKTIQRVSSDEYVMNKAVPEVKQLLTDYGPIGIFWWDTPRKMSRESFDALHSLTKLQPDVITNDRLGEGYVGDYKTFERHIPQQTPVDKDWEVCMPISGSWGYKIGDNDFKSMTKIIRNLIQIASMGGNYLLNVSPTGEGTLLPPAIKRLEEIGAWMDINGDSIYGTQGSPFGNLDWGRCTRKETDDISTLYLHVYDWPADGKLLVPGLENTVQGASLLNGGLQLDVESTDEGVTISLPAEPPNQHASVVVLNVAGSVTVEAQLPTVGADGRLVLAADKAYINNNEGSANAGLREHDDIPHIGYWVDGEAFVEWAFRTKDPGDYEVRAVMSVQEPKTRFGIGLVEKPLMVETETTGGYGKYVERTLGTIRIDNAGEHTFRVKPDASAWNPINLRQVELRLKKN